MVTSKSAMTPSLSGRTARMRSGGATEILLGLPAHGQNGVAADVERHHRRLVEHDAILGRIQERVGRTQIHGQIFAEKTEKLAEKHIRLPDLKDVYSG